MIDAGCIYMSLIRIVTDSTADLNPDLYSKNNIEVVPLKVLFGQQVFRDGVDISPTDFYNRLISTDDLPSTSQPSPGDFLKVYQKLLDDGAETIISIHISSKLSGTAQTAQVAANMLPDADITVIDSQYVHGALGLIVLAAAKAAARGCSKEEVLSLVQDLMGKMEVYFIVDTLEYLQRGGRIGKAEALLGSVLNIKPILTVKEGIIQPFAKVRGKNKAINKMIEAAVQKSGGRKVVGCFLHASDPTGLLQVKEKAFANLNIAEYITIQVGPVVGTHVGPGTVGFIFYCPD